MKKIIFLISAVILTLAMASARPTFSANDPPGYSILVQTELNNIMTVSTQTVYFAVEHVTPFNFVQDISPGSVENYLICAERRFTFKSYLPEIRRLTHWDGQTFLNNNLCNSDKTIGLIYAVINTSFCQANRCRAV
jgi:hypothetical protein